MQKLSFFMSILIFLYSCKSDPEYVIMPYEKIPNETTIIEVGMFSAEAKKILEHNYAVDVSVLNKRGYWYIIPGDYSIRFTGDESIQKLYFSLHDLVGELFDDKDSVNKVDIGQYLPKSTIIEENMWTITAHYILMSMGSKLVNIKSMNLAFIESDDRTYITTNNTCIQIRRYGGNDILKINYITVGEVGKGYIKETWGKQEKTVYKSLDVSKFR